MSTRPTRAEIEELKAEIQALGIQNAELEANLRSAWDARDRWQARYEAAVRVAANFNARLWVEIEALSHARVAAHPAYLEGSHRNLLAAIERLLAAREEEPTDEQ